MALELTDREMLIRIDTEIGHTKDAIAAMNLTVEQIHKRISDTNKLISGPDGLDHRITIMESSIKTMKAVVSTVGALFAGLGGYIGFK